MYDISQELWARASPDDWRFMWLMLIDSFTDLPIKSVKSGYHHIHLILLLS